MKPRIAFSLAIVLVLLLSGCASNERSPAMREWARQQVAEKQRAEAAQAAYAQEVARLKAENERVKAQAESDRQKADAADQRRKEAEINARMEKNMEEITAQFTEAFYPLRQDLMNAAKFTGTLAFYKVDGVMLKNHIFYVSHLMAWKNSDGTGSFGRYYLGYDTQTEKWVTGDASEVAHLSREVLQGISNKTSERPPIPENTKSVWAPTNETINAGYRAAAVAAIPILIDMLFGD